MKRIQKTVVFQDGIQIAVEEQEIDVPVPYHISARQMRLHLRSIGMLDQIPALLNALPDDLREDAWIEWEYGTTIERDSRLLMQIAQSLGLSDEQIDEFFILASER